MDKYLRTGMKLCKVDLIRNHTVFLCDGISGTEWLFWRVLWSRNVMLEQQSDVVFVFCVDIFCLKSYELGMEPIPLTLFEAAVEECTMSNSGGSSLE
jgi:hypothetical protein